MYIVAFLFHLKYQVFSDEDFHYFGEIENWGFSSPKNPSKLPWFHTVQHSLQASNEIPLSKDCRIYPKLCKHSPLWKCLNTHNKNPLLAQWILIRDQLLTDFLHCGNSFWKILQCWEMKISHCHLLSDT